VATLTATIPPAVVRTPADEQSDLAADLAALAEGSAVPNVHNVQSRPAILRRLAARLADGVAPGTDRLVGELAYAPLVTAVSLHTGVPFALVDVDNHHVLGELHPSERVVVITYAGGHLGVQNVINECGATVTYTGHALDEVGGQ